MGGEKAMKKRSNKDRLVTVEEAAKLFTVSKPTVWRMLRARQLPAVRITKRTTRIKLSDIEAHIESHYQA